MRTGSAGARGPFAIGLLAALVTTVSCSDRPLEPGVSNSAPSTVSGHVTAGASGGVASATVQLAHGSTKRSAITDSTGTYSFDNVSGGNYELSVVVPLGYEVPAGGRASADGKRAIVDATITVRGTPVTRDVILSPVLASTRTVKPGGTDTVFTSGGMMVAMTGSALAPATNVSITQTASPSLLDTHRPVAPTIALKFSGVAASPSIAVRSSALSARASVPVMVSVASLLTDPTKAVRLLVKVLLKGSSTPLTLWADATSTSFSAGGAVTTVPLAQFGIDPGVVGEISLTLVSATSACTTPTETLKELPTDTKPLGSRVPLVLIHGWQYDMIDCSEWASYEAKTDPFNAMAAQVLGDATVAANFKPYLYRYYTRNRVLAASDALAVLLAQKALVRPVVIGHSMGGLVGRGLLVRKGVDVARAIVTLGTPHAGSPLADAILESSKGTSTSSSCYTGTYLLSLVPFTDGVDDLRTTGDLATLLGQAATQPKDRIFALGGVVGSVLTDPTLSRLGCVVTERGGGSNDGIVPLSSALPTWAALQIRRDGFDHSEMATGESNSASDPLFANLRAVLAGLADCSPAPSRPTSNAFPLSASAVRTSSRTINVTINPILIGGVPAALSGSNVEVIENGCSKHLTVTTGTGPIDADIVFIQDLSGSMSAEIVGVRNSVTAFANDLLARGLSVRIGSVGYSGNGSIPTSPPTSSCEFLGPVRDLTDPATFRAHVAASWSAFDGCDGPENGLEAIEYAHQSLSWRPGAARVYILITDSSVHTKATSCNSLGPCTNQDLASITALVGSTATMHVVAPSNSAARTTGGGLDPWQLADALGGKRLTLATNGVVDLVTLNLSATIGQVVRLSYESASNEKATHDLRVRVTLPLAGVSEIATGLAVYQKQLAPPIVKP
jgi:pimeloyl-ACP methyl ester carboxylesterase